MGNRAVVTFTHSPELAIYCHWNGGSESIRAFLQCAQRYGIRGDSYGVARLAQIVGNFFGGNLSLGLSLLKESDQDNWDNGVFVVNEKWQIVERRFQRYPDGDDIAYQQGVFLECCKKNDPIFGYEEAL